ncbi:hypothetical protein OLEAN_C08630 [Oleispira antarctica RB-8]|uniref:Uncharacterized protein n=1 Tax=Oleispira antarctica RB-8 TaxID=698738 RepID=R4YSF3_OLEAN|nr:hypothetical protein OLEAN_C08630 [Oleispira antarctica RB-8]
MNISSQESGLVMGRLQEASAINKTVCAFIAAKGAGQDLVIGDDEALGFVLILEQLGNKLDEAEKALRREGIN